MRAYGTEIIARLKSLLGGYTLRYHSPAVAPYTGESLKLSHKFGSIYSTYARRGAHYRHYTQKPPEKKRDTFSFVSAKIRSHMTDKRDRGVAQKFADHTYNLDHLI